MVVYHERNLIINYIPRNLSDLDLSNLFSIVGPIKTCRIIRDHSSGNSFGFGFCEYEDAESAHRAIERFNGYRIADKILKVSLAKLQGRLYQSSNLYVKNFPLTVTDEEIATEFSRFGKVLQCRVLRDRETNTSKGSAYVLFENRTDAECARKSLDGTVWPGSSDGHILAIKFATPPYRQPSSGNQNKPNTKTAVTISSEAPTDEQRPSQFQAIQNSSGFGCDQVMGSGSHYYQDPLCGTSGQTAHASLALPFGLQSSQSSPGLTWVPDYIPESVAVTPLSFASSYLPPYILPQNPSFPGMWPTVQPSLNAHAYGFLYGHQLDSLTSAVHGCPILTGLPNSFSNSNLQNTGLCGLFSGLLANNNGIRKLKVNKNERPNVASVYVYNIGNLMTERRLSELFSRFGSVLNVSIPRDPKTNLTRNFGFVTFGSMHCAQLAISSMNGLFYDGRRLQVSLRKPRNSVTKACGDFSSKLFVGVSEANGLDRVENPVDLDSDTGKNEKISTSDSCAENLKSLHLNDVITSQNSINSCPAGITT